MSAVALVLQLLEPGDVLVAAHDCYGGTQRLLRALAKKQHFELVFADLTSPRATEEIARRPPRLRLDRDAEQSVAPHHRHPTARRRGASRRDSRRRRQHLPVARPAAADLPRRGHRRPLDDEVSQRTQRRRRRRGDRARRRHSATSWPGGPTASASPVRRSIAISRCAAFARCTRA